MKSIFLFFFIVATLCKIFAAKYYTLNGIKYFISYPMVHNWYEANRFCTFNAMYTVGIHSFEDDQQVLAIIQQFRIDFNLTSDTIHFWTSGTDQGHSVNDFYWSTTGYPVIYKNWITGLPVNGDFNPHRKGTKDCLLLNSAHSYQWFDEYCAIRYPVICQDKLSLPKRFSDAQCEL